MRANVRPPLSNWSTRCVAWGASLLQAVTSLQEQTLTFIPKVVALGGLTLLLTPWLLRSISEFTISIITRMGTIGQ